MFLRDGVQRNRWKSVLAPEEVCLIYLKNVKYEQLQCSCYTIRNWSKVEEGDKWWVCKCDIIQTNNWILKISMQYQIIYQSYCFIVKKIHVKIPRISSHRSVEVTEIHKEDHHRYEGIWLHWLRFQWISRPEEEYYINYIHEQRCSNIFKDE